MLTFSLNHDDLNDFLLVHRNNCVPKQLENTATGRHFRLTNSFSEQGIKAISGKRYFEALQRKSNFRYQI